MKRAIIFVCFIQWKWLGFVFDRGLYKHFFVRRVVFKAMKRQEAPNRMRVSAHNPQKLLKFRV